MKITLPVQSKEIKDGKVVTTESEQEFELDMSLNAQIRYETKFPELAEREDLFHYGKRICELKNQSAGLLLSQLKLIYCWFDTEMSFKEFSKLFDLSDGKYLKKLVDRLREVFEIISNSSAEKN